MEEDPKHPENVSAPSHYDWPQDVAWEEGYRAGWEARSADFDPKKGFWTPHDEVDDRDDP